MVKSRRVILTMDVETDVKLADLKKIKEIHAYDKDSHLLCDVLTIIRIQADLDY